MNGIINLIGKRNKAQKTLNLSDIIFIVNYICALYNITLSHIRPMSDLLGDNADKSHFMVYEAHDNILYINYAKIKEYDSYSFNNYRIIFTIVHELRHCSQFNYCLTKDDSVAYLYLICFDTLSQNNIISRIFYSKNHDYFPTEINADIVGILFVLYVTKALGDEIFYEIYLTELEIRIKKALSKRAYDVLISLYGANEFKNLQENMDEYGQFSNGILKEEEKCNNIKQMILS